MTDDLPPNDRSIPRYEVLSNTKLSADVHQLVVRAPRVAAARQPGQFVIVRLGPGAERIPLTIADSDSAEGSILLVIQVAGKSTSDLVALAPGTHIHDIVGPLGRPSDLVAHGTAVCVAGGVGAAVMLPIARRLAELGVEVITVLGARTSESVLFDKQLASFAEVVVCTDDGSAGRAGFVTDALRDLLARRSVDVVYAAGPVPMMRAVVAVTGPLGVRTHRVAQPDHGGRHRHVRRVSGDGRRDHALRLRRRPRVRRTRRRLRRAVRSAQHVRRIRAGGLQPRLPGGGVNGEALSKRERLTIDRQEMPTRDAHERSRSFDEVNVGFTERLAMLEAQRCLACKRATCVDGCPVMVDIPTFLRRIEEGDLAGAARVLFADNALPAVTGRVCPQEHQCEAECVRGRKGAPVAIGHLERFVADWARGHVHDEPPTSERSGKRVAIVGSGPGGLTAAGELARRGHEVTIYEALHVPGGVLSYGIPEFRLPNEIVAHEVHRLEALGVHIECNVVIGRTYTLDDLRDRFDALFISVGAGLPIFLGIPGEGLKGVYTANEYLTRVNLMQAYAFPDADTPVLHGDRVVVIGGGNVAVDAVRTARRLGAVEAKIVYRRNRPEMPARVEEIHHAEEEGVSFEFQVSPVAIEGNADRWVTGLRCVDTELGEPDASGRRAPMPIEGSERVIPCDTVVVAVGTRANPLLTSSSPDLALTERGYLAADERGMTNLPGVFAGGDIVRGSATVILAMGDGKRIAGAIDDFLHGTIVELSAR